MQSVETMLEPFAGYFHLGMFHEANDALDDLPTEFKTHPKVLLARFSLLLEMKRWDDGVLLGESLIRLWPQELEFHFKTAYCLHELKRTKEVKETLEAAPVSIRGTAVFHFNLACYAAQLGHLDEAKKLLTRCFEKEPRFKEEALDDPDLEPVWKSL